MNVSKSPPRRRHLVAIDIEEEVQHAGLVLLMRLDIPARERVLENWGRRAPMLPLTNAKGDVLDEHPVDDRPPPLIKFIHEQQETAEAAA